MVTLFVLRSQAALNLLSCLDTITSSPVGNLAHSDDDNTRLGSAKAYSKAELQRRFSKILEERLTKFIRGWEPFIALGPDPVSSGLPQTN